MNITKNHSSQQNMGFGANLNALVYEKYPKYGEQFAREVRRIGAEHGHNVTIQNTCDPKSASRLLGADKFDVLVLSNGSGEGYNVLGTALKKKVPSEIIAIQSTELTPADKRELQDVGITPVTKFSNQLGDFLHGVFAKTPK